MATINAATDAALIIIPVAIVYPLQMPAKTRLVLISLFFSRGLCVPITILSKTVTDHWHDSRTIIAIICQLVYLPRLFEDDFTLHSYPYYISTQSVQCTSVSTACITYFWPFLRSLQSGLMSADNRAFTPQYTLPALGSGDAKNSCRDFQMPRGHTRDRREYINITN